MGMERVTVEQNGERFTLEVPEGTTDEQVQQFLAEQQQTAGGMTNPNSIPPNPAENVGTYAAQAAAPAATNLAANAAQAVWNAPATALTAPITSPISTVRNVAGAVERAIPQVPTQVPGPAGGPVVSMPGSRAMTVGELIKAGGRGAMGALTAPENLLTLPYNMAAYEQAKIRQNPNAPGLEYNPYAQVQRGEASTQGRAGAANQMRAVANMPYGNVTPQERAILDEDFRMKSAVRKKAFEKVMGPVAPGPR